MEIAEMSKSSSQARSRRTPHPRYVVSLLMILSIVLLMTIVQRFAMTSSRLRSLFGAFLHIFVVFFALMWTRLHSISFSKTCRIWFDERNLLENYQTRARTLGHLFKPDPPTPNPLITVAPTESSDDEDRPTDSKKTFTQMRDKFYNKESTQIAKDKQYEAEKGKLPSSSSDKSLSETQREEPIYENINGPIENLPDPPK